MIENFEKAYTQWEYENYKRWEQKSEGTFYNIDEQEDDREYWEEFSRNYILRQAENDY